MRFKLLKNKEKIKEYVVLKNKKTQEKSRGRSMVEMLGVLAIIGVLSIGGIQGYTMAMRKYRANEILNFLEKYALSCYTSAHQSILNGDGYIRDDGGWFIHGYCPEYSEKPVLNLIDFANTFIVSRNSGDLVMVTARVDNKELCETLVSIADLGNIDDPVQCRYEPKWYNGKDTYYLYLSFLMN